jgi:hypothetical protein
MEGKTQEAAASAAAMSERSARKWESGPLPSETKSERSWRTRNDPFEAVWDSDVVPLLEADLDRTLEAKTVLGELLDRYPGVFERGQLRTLQRRFREWRALHGPEKEVFFPQEHVPGKRASLDFTHCAELGVTIAGQPFPHLLFVLRLAFSGWTFAMLAFSETFEALVSGMQAAFWKLGGVADELCHDCLSAATHELKKTGGRAFNTRWQAVLDHYGLKGVKINPGKANENGVAEKGNDLLKSTLTQRLKIRGSSDFPTVDAWMSFVRDTIARMNSEIAEHVMAAELDALRALPHAAVPSYTTCQAKVRKWSTIRVGGRVYSVPSRLIGHTVDVRLHPDEVEVRYGGKVVERIPRLRGERRRARIDYRHVIWSLVKKPGAFAQYRFREELFPTLVFRHAYGAFKTFRGERADVEYVRVLHLAASTMECEVERALVELLRSGEPFDYVDVKALAAPQEATIPTVEIGEPDLTTYDDIEAVR